MSGAVEGEGRRKEDALQLSDEQGVICGRVKSLFGKVVKGAGGLGVEATCVLDGEGVDFCVVAGSFSEGGQPCWAAWFGDAALEFVVVCCGDVRHNNVEHGGVVVGACEDVYPSVLGAGLWVACGRW